MPGGVGFLTRESSDLAVGFEQQENVHKRRPDDVFMVLGNSNDGFRLISHDFYGKRTLYQVFGNPHSQKSYFEGFHAFVVA